MTKVNKNSSIVNEESMDYAKSALALEGMYVSEEQEKLVREKIEGKITQEEFIKKMVELASGK